MTGKSDKRCPGCNSPAVVRHYDGGTWEFDCTRCGTVTITDVAEDALRDRFKTSAQIANISGYFRENSGILIKERDLDFLFELRTPSFFEKALRIFQRIAKEFPDPGENIDINIWGAGTLLVKIFDGNEHDFDEKFISNCQVVLPWLSCAWLRDGTELLYIIQRFLQDSKGFLEKGLASGDFCITPEGWSFLMDLNQNTRGVSTAFVAMWFNPSMEEVWTEGFYPGTADAGYHALRIDKHQHNNRIDDEIIVKIKECKFLVADFTGGRGGVYFEAGLALGQGKPVIWVVREDELNSIHFDNRQYCFITWKPGELPKLRRDLHLRIEATIGKGPLVSR